ncbi:xanthine dehydrogenase family protein molybdopterin-binding subunit [Aquincola sp. S2]|uniref:Xanthine dehydrogenase family protein molybdopterin-binding subunit n=2 Tax=Pseudaquabacterium terrae TaxID=2732868 RepID=A0ABX2EKS4_9BURK|nr:xanthine dehydrogenase family protein molybdopterin-binding subunit [Aquabacterium terrae]
MRPTGPSLRRRSLLVAGAGAAGALVLPLRLGAQPAASAGERFEPNAFIRITPDDRVLLTSHRAEMGQGTRTALAMILCDELDADWSRVQVQRADGDARYGDQNTVGDATLILTWEPLRQAAAAARTMLVQAAAEQLKLPVDALRTEAGRVLAKDGSKSLRYGALVRRAAKLPVPAAPMLKSPADYTLIGKPTPGVDLRAQTTGTMVYGLDVQRPGMRYAVIARAPLPDVKLKRFDDRAARAVTGVEQVFALDGVFRPEGTTDAGVVVVARDSWACLQARKQLQIEWDAPPSPDSAQIRQRLEDAATQAGTVYRSNGDFDAARREGGGTVTVSRRYYTPLLIHAPLEPPNCTADVRADRCEIWAPTQNPGEARERIAEELKCPIEQVTVHVTDIGGGFGRKAMHDFVLEAVRIGRRIGQPVKLFWSREDDLRHGFYRSPCVQAIEAGAEPQGRPLYWRHHTAHGSQQPTSEAVSPRELQMGEVLSGATRLPYPFPHLRIEGTHVDMPLRRAWMRGVQHAFHGFAVESALDELAVKLGRDPLAWRLEQLEPARRTQFIRSRASTEFWFDSGRLAGVIRRVAELSNWSAPLPAGGAARGRGFAAHVQSATYVALVAEVSRRGPALRVERVCCVVDCGRVINPDSARAQVEGAIVYGLSSCLFGEITLGGGAVQQSNFHDYPVARIGDMPRIDVAFIHSGVAPTGLGEPCVPMVAPAIANAVANAGWGRLTEWPLKLPAAAA